MSVPKYFKEASVGRPALWADPQELIQKIEDYKKRCEELNKPFTLAGLAVEVGCDRKTLLNYSQRDEFFPAVKLARTYAEAYMENYLYSGKPVAGAIFAAKNNFAWKDEREVNVTQVNINTVLSSLNTAPKQDDIIEGELVEPAQELLDEWA